MVQPNVLFIHGWGPDKLFGGALEALRSATIAEFKRTIYCPPAVDYQEVGLISRYLQKWEAPQILVCLSCGCGQANQIASNKPNERFPFIMYCSPSVPCGMNPIRKLGAVPSNVGRALQVTPNFDPWFNPFRLHLIYPAPGNKTTKFEFMQSNRGHGTTPLYPPARVRLFDEIRRAQNGVS